MADKIKVIKIKQQNGTYSEEVPISVNVQNVQWDENNHTLLDALGSVDISSSGKGNLQHQIDELDGDKISTNQFNSRLNDFLKDQISADTTDWLDDNVNPVGSAVIVDKTLTIEGAAADALAVKTELNKKANASNTYTKAEVNAAIDAKQIEVDDTLSITGTAADAKAVGDELTAVKADLSEKEEIEYTAEGYYINTNLQYAEVDNPQPSSTGFKYAIVDCSEGDKFVINAVGGSGGRAWAFANSSNLILSVAEENATVANLVLTAPNGTAKLIINNKGTGISYKLGAFVTDRVSDLEEKIDNFEPLSDNIKRALLECFQNVAWIGADSKTYYDNLVNALYQSIYSIDVPTTFNGTSDYIDTGIQLFNTDKSFTIFCDCTENTENPLLRNYQIFHCMMTDSPWPGLEASFRKTDANDKSPIRIAYYGGVGSQSYESATGVGNRNVKIAVSHESASSSLSIAVSVNDNLVLYDNVVYNYGSNEKSLVIGVAKRDDGTLTSTFFKGTVNNFKVYNVSFSLNDLRNMVLNGGAQ